MAKQTDANDDDDLRPEYDASTFQGAVRGKYVDRMHEPKAEDNFAALPTYRSIALDIPTAGPCPWCGRVTDNIKRYTLITLVFLLAFFIVRHDEVANCPSCMRKALLQRTLLNVLTANVFCPIVIVWHGILFVRTFFGRPR